jgi:hypothetical protein
LGQVRRSDLASLKRLRSEQLLDTVRTLEKALFPVMAQAGFERLTIRLDPVRPKVLSHKSSVSFTK